MNTRISSERGLALVTVAPSDHVEMAGDRALGLQGMGLRWRISGTFYFYFFIVLVFIYRLHYGQHHHCNTQGQREKELAARDIFASRAPLFF